MANANPKNLNATVGSYKIDAWVDDDGHLNFVVAHADGSPVRDTEEGPSCEDNEVSMRFTTETIEANAVKF